MWNGSDRRRGTGSRLTNGPTEAAAETPPAPSTPAVVDEIRRRKAASWLTAGAYLLAIAIAETVTTLLSARVGLIVHLLVAVTFSLHGATSDERRALLRAIALAPLTRILSLSLLSSRVSPPNAGRTVPSNGRGAAPHIARRAWHLRNGSDRRLGGGSALADRPTEAAVETLPAPSTPAVVDQTRGRKAASWLTAGTYLLAIAIAETVTTLVSARVGLIVHLAVALTLTLHGATTSDDRRALLWTLALAPLTRILSLSLPLMQFPFIYWYVVVGAPIAAAAVVAARALGYSRSDLGLSLRLSAWNISVQLAMAPLGFALGVFGYLIIQPQPLTGSPRLEDVWLPALVLALSAGFTEELVFRGLLQRSALRLLGPWGFFFTATVFATLQLGHGSGQLVAYAFSVGLLFAALAHVTRSLLGVMLARASMAITLLLIAPFLDLSLPAGLPWATP